MRARGAQVTDIAIIVIADDDIMPQTKEMITHKQLKRTNDFAINIDKPNSNPEKLKKR
jgi:translation initiation factor IF-2